MGMMCGATGCSDEAVQLVPDPDGHDDALLELIGAPIFGFCSLHAHATSDLYARAVAHALLAQYCQGRAVDREHLQAVCDQLRGMATNTAQATYAILGRLEGIV